MRNVLIFSALILMASASLAGTIVLEGNYQGKNLYVQNPFAGSGVGFCTYEVTINGDVTTDEINSSAFEIDFTNFQLQIGEKIVVTIKHKDDCRPKVLNAEVLKPRSTFEIISMNVSKEGILDWKSNSETGKLSYVVEQFRWNKWIKIGEVEGKGVEAECNYSFQTTPHSGENQFRVKQVDYTGKPRYSKPARFKCLDGEITFTPIKVKDYIDFTSESMFEIYDSYGNIVKKGFADKVDASNLSKGIYYLNYDNKTDKFVKK
jgi:hypothetical protein